MSRESSRPAERSDNSRGADIVVGDQAPPSADTPPACRFSTGPETAVFIRIYRHKCKPRVSERN